MDIERARKLSYNTIRQLYKTHLQSKELGRNTVSTVIGDSLYLWNNADKDVFWDTVASDDFETAARENLLDCLNANSTGDIKNLINGYVSNLRRFRNFILSYDMPEEDDETALKSFLLDIDCLNALSEWTCKFNLFDVLKISRTEIRHSNVLSWLLNPSENHGLGDSVLRGLIQFVVSTYSGDIDVFDALLLDCHDFLLQREWHSIDILAVSEKQKYVIAIENKIDSKEHDNQLSRYKRILDDTYPSYKKILIYLSPDGDESSDPESWYSMSYKDILSSIENARQNTKLLPEASLLIDNYIDTVRRDIVGDARLAHICAEIYAKHQKALDLIFENKPDRASQLADIMHSWASMMTDKGELEFVADKSGKVFTRFKTKAMSELLPDSDISKSGWGTSNYYFYEIKCINGEEFLIQFAVSSVGIPDDLRATCEQINRVYPSKQQKSNWKWRTHFASKHAKIKPDEELSEEKIYNQLSKQFEEVKHFESTLKAKLLNQ